MDRTTVDSRIEDVEYAANIIPFNLEVGKRILGGTVSGSAPIAEFNQDNVNLLHADVSDYVGGLHGRLEGLFSDDNAALAKRLDGIDSTPVTLSYFQLQQKLLAMTGDSNPLREKEMLTKLAELMRSQ